MQTLYTVSVPWSNKLVLGFFLQLFYCLLILTPGYSSLTTLL